MKFGSKLTVFLASILVLPLFFFNILPVWAQSPTLRNVKAQGATRSAEGQLRSCEAREESVHKRMDQLNKLTEKMFGNFDKIAGRVETYYTDTVLPGGKTLPNYSLLVADIASKKANVQTALVTAQNDSAAFACGSALGPKAQLTKYRTDMQAVKKALKEYRTSIKNLIVAVHSAKGTK